MQLHNYLSQGYGHRLYLAVWLVNETKAEKNLMRLGTQEMLGVLEVKGEATEASSSEREMPP